jgi:hypothetical protein
MAWLYAVSSCCRTLLYLLLLNDELLLQSALADFRQRLKVSPMWTKRRFRSRSLEVEHSCSTHAARSSCHLAAWWSAPRTERLLLGSKLITKAVRGLLSAYYDSLGDSRAAAPATAATGQVLAVGNGDNASEVGQTGKMQMWCCRVDQYCRFTTEVGEPAAACVRVNPWTAPKHQQRLVAFFHKNPLQTYTYTIIC